MKYSVVLFPLEAWSSLDEIVATTQTIERLGFHSLGLSEHLFTPVAPDGDRSPLLPSTMWADNFGLGAVLARSTTTLRIMLSALIVPYRHPVVAAQQVATLDWISGARLDVTTGVGWLEPEFEALGISIRDRGARTDDYLRAMRSLWNDEYPEHSGPFVSFKDVAVGLKPNVPLLIGGANKRAYDRVVEFEAAGWAPMLASTDTVREGLVRLRALFDDAGRDIDPLRVYTRIAILGGNTSINESGSHVVGAPSGGRVPAAAGRRSPDETIEQIASYIDAGVNEIGLSFPWTSADDYVETLEWFMAEVAPHT